MRHSTGEWGRKSSKQKFRAWKWKQKYEDIFENNDRYRKRHKEWSVYPLGAIVIVQWRELSSIKKNQIKPYSTIEYVEVEITDVRITKVGRPVYIVKDKDWNIYKYKTEKKWNV